MRTATLRLSRRFPEKRAAPPQATMERAEPDTPAPTGTGRRVLFASLLLAVLGGFPMPGAQAAGGFRLKQAEVLREPRHFLVNLRIDYHLSPEMLDTLLHGIPLQLRVEVELRRLGWLYDPLVRRLNHQRRLEYHVLRGLYQVTDLQDDTRRYFAQLREALRSLGNLRRLHLALRTPSASSNYRMRARAGLVIDALPAPLQPRAYLHPSWRTALSWRELPLP